jgi:hypothetical protein
MSASLNRPVGGPEAMGPFFDDYGYYDYGFNCSRSERVGGGFGSKLGIHAETILAAPAARELGRANQELSQPTARAF